jgi:photoactive yellow protein
MVDLTCSFSKGENMQNQSPLYSLPLGLLELDANGTVLYYKPDRDNASVCSAADVIGRNLFTDVAPIAEDKEFQERIKTFRRRHAPADSFHFTFGSGQSYLAVKVLLARIHEQSVLGNTESILIHMRRQATRMAA